MAPVRELVQNAVDAVLLKKAVSKSPADLALAALPIKLSLHHDKHGSALTVQDWGVGMSQRIIADHLLTIASDYWDTQYFSDYPGGARDFTPTGRFGIGFLSVFMLGEEVSISTERSGASRYQLLIHGLGRRAELRKEATAGYSGSEIKVTLKQNAASELSDLKTLCECYFPLLPVPLEITSSDETLTLEPSWLMAISADALRKWTKQTYGVLRRADGDNEMSESLYINLQRFNNRISVENDETFWITDAPEYTEPGVRLLADKAGVSILCLRGFSLQSVRTPGFVGVINSETVTPDASRRRAIDIKVEPILERARLAIRPRVSSGLDALGGQGFSTNLTELLSWCCQVYGADSIVGSSFRFIQIVETDGTSRYISADTLRELASTTSSFFVALNIGPNTLLKNWQSRQSESVEAKLAICFASGSFSLSYHNEEKTGTLKEIWPSWPAVPLFSVVMTVLEKAWGLESGTLVHQDRWRHISSEVSGFFRQR